MPRTVLKEGAFLLLPTLAGCGLHEFNGRYVGPLDFKLVLSSWLGLLTLLCMLLACYTRWLCAVFRFLPREEKLFLIALRGVYASVVPHAVFLLIEEATVGTMFDRDVPWYTSFGCAVAAGLLFAVAFARQRASATVSMLPRVLIFLATAFALYHARPLVNMKAGMLVYFEYYPYELSGTLLPYAVACAVLLPLAARFRIHFNSPIPRFSLLTLLLLVSAGFSGVAMGKYWPAWSFEKSLHEEKEIENPWGTFGPFDALSALTTDGVRALTAAKDVKKKLWNCDTGRLIAELKESHGEALYARFSPDGSTLALVTREYVLLSRQSEKTPFSLEKVLERYPEKEDPIWNTSPLYSVGQFNVLWLYDAHDGKLLATQRGPSGERNVAFSSDSRRVLVFSAETGAYVFDARTGRQLAHRDYGGNEWQLQTLDQARKNQKDNPDEKIVIPRLLLPVKALNGIRLVVDDHDPALGDLQIVTSALESFCRAINDNRADTCVTPDGETLLFQRLNGVVEAFNVQDGALLWRTPPQLSADRTVSSFESGRIVIFDHSGADNALAAFIHDARTGAVLRRWNLRLAARHDWKDAMLENRSMLLVSDDGLIVLDPRSLQPVRVMKSWSPVTSSDKWAIKGIRSQSVSSDGSTLLDTGSQGTARVWRFRHPPQWWGVATVPLFWIVLALTGALLWSLARDYRA